MNAKQIKGLLPRKEYTDARRLVDEIKTILKQAFPKCESIERDSPAFVVYGAGAHDRNARVEFSPDERLPYFTITIHDGKVEKVIDSRGESSESA